MLNAEPSPCPSHPSLDLVIHHQDPILVKHLLQPLEIVVRRNNISALALDRLDEHRRNILWRQILVKDLFLDKIDTVHPALRIRQLERTTVTVSKGNMRVPRNHGEEVSTQVGLAGS